MRYLAVVFALLLALTGWPAKAQDEAGESQSEQAGETEEQTEEEAEDEAEAEAEESRRVRRLGDVVGEGSEEWSMDTPALDFPTQPAEPPPDVSLPDPEQDSQLQSLLTTRAFAPDDPDVQAGIASLMDDVEADATEALAAGDLALAQRLVEVIREVSPGRGGVGEIQAEVDRREAVASTLAGADEALADGNWTTPPEESAVALYEQVLELEPDNEQAAQGLVNTRDAMVESAIELAEEDFDFEAAQALLDEAAEVHDDEEAIAAARESIDEIREARIAELDQATLTAIDEARYDDAEEVITQLVALGHDRSRIDRLRGSLEDARLYGSFEPGQEFTDTPEGIERPGPEMVVMPAGSFQMGSPENEEDRMSNEGPQHRVTFDRGFAMAKTEITVGEFSIFVSETGYRTDAERAGASRIYQLNSGRMTRESGVNWRHDYSGREADDDLPVIHVSWNDANAYARWLAEETGRNYRLPTEAEFEYALRAGTQTPYWWGTGSPDEDVENVTGDGDASPTDARWNVAFRRYSDGYWGPGPVGSLETNPLGLHDMGGNVMEWVEDCWHDSYVRAPGDGSAWVNPGCERRVIRGGSWSSTPAMSRSAFRIASNASSTDMRVGFRVARDL